MGILPPEMINTGHLRPMLLQRTRKSEKYEYFLKVAQWHQ